MGGASWSCVVWIVEWVWAGRGLALAERWAAGRVSWVGSRGCGWLVRVGIGDTLSAACVWWWWVPPFCVLGACGGGMLSGFWGSAPWLPGLSGAPDLLGVVGGCGWVGCELYSGREHLTVRFLRQVS